MSNIVTNTLPITAIQGINTGTVVLATFTIGAPNQLFTVNDFSAVLTSNGWGDGTPSDGIIVLSSTSFLEQIDGMPQYYPYITDDYPFNTAIQLTIVAVGYYQSQDSSQAFSTFNILGSYTYLNSSSADGYPLSILLMEKFPPGMSADQLIIPGGACIIHNSGTINVLPSQLSGSNGTTISGVAGTQLPVQSNGKTFITSFTDTNIFNTNLSNYAATIYWGDGNSSSTNVPGYTTPVILQILTGTATCGNWGVFANYTYNNAGIYSITTKISNISNYYEPDRQSSVLISSTAFISAAIIIPPLPSIYVTLNDFTAIQGVDTGVIQLATFTCTRPDAVPSNFTAVITNWGDGPTYQYLVINQIGSTDANSIFEITGNHTYNIPIAMPTYYAGQVSIEVIPITGYGDSFSITSDTDTGQGVIVIPTTITITLNDNITATIGIDTGVIQLATFICTNPSASASDFSALITSGGWGDRYPISPAIQYLTINQIGSTVTGPIFEISGNHTYINNIPDGLYPFTIEIIPITNGYGTTTTMTSSSGYGITLISTTIEITLNDFTAMQGVNTGMIQLATFTSSNMTATVSDFIAHVNDWGDGAVYSPLPVINQIGGSNDGILFEICSSHMYTSAPSSTPYQIIIKIDPRSRIGMGLAGAGGVITTSSSGHGVTVIPAPLQGYNNTVVSGIAGSQIYSTAPSSLTLIGSFTDANQFSTNASNYIITVNWGNGSSLASVLSSNMVALGSTNNIIWNIYASYTYSSQGTYPITILVTNISGASLNISSSAVISGAAPLISSSSPPLV